MRKMLLLSILFSLVSAGLVFAATPTKTVAATFVSFKAADSAVSTDDRLPQYTDEALPLLT